MKIMGDDAIKPTDADAFKNPQNSGSAQSPQPAIPPSAQDAPSPLPPNPIIVPQKEIPPAAVLPIPNPATAEDASMQNDMAKILGGVKLPERHNQTAPKQDAQSAKYDTTLADPTREMPHAVVGFTPPEQPDGTAPGKDNVGSLHTLKDDLQHVVQENKISYVRAVALEEEKRHRIEQRSPAPHVNRRSLFTLFIVMLLIGTGLLALGAVFVVMQQRSGAENASLRSSILFSEQSVPFPVDNESPGDVRRLLASARNSGSLTLGAILEIVPVTTVTDPDSGQPVTRPITFGAFLDALGTRAPEGLVRALADNFFFGIHTVDENAPVMIIPVTSYERAFAAMLEWEPYMNADLEPLFTALSPQTTAANGTAVERKFEDTVMRNYDVRALKDDQGTIQLYYSFPTRNILIIAESPFSFTELLSRLRADRRL